MLRICTNCGKDTDNPKFCSRHCAASYNNARFPKRVRQPCYCRKCGIDVGKRRTYCDTCLHESNGKGDITIAEATYKKHHRSNAFTLIRSRARQIGKQQDWKACLVCGYDKHFEIAHIKDIGSFPDDTRISEINALDNLLPLCRNCHWEFDHGLLKMGLTGFEPVTKALSEQFSN